MDSSTIAVNNTPIDQTIDQNIDALYSEPQPLPLPSISAMAAIAAASAAAISTQPQQRIIADSTPLAQTPAIAVGAVSQTPAITVDAVSQPQQQIIAPQATRTATLPQVNSPPDYQLQERIRALQASMAERSQLMELLQQQQRDKELLAQLEYASQAPPAFQAPHAFQSSHARPVPPAFQTPRVTQATHAVQAPRVYQAPPIPPPPKFLSYQASQVAQASQAAQAAQAPQAMRAPRVAQVAQAQVAQALRTPRVAQAAQAAQVRAPPPPGPPLQYTVFLEKYCPNHDCPDRGNPEKCPLNHCRNPEQQLVQLDKGTPRPAWFCMNEFASGKFAPNGSPCRCTKLKCGYAHGAGRAKFVLAKLAQQQEAGPRQNEPSVETSEDAQTPPSHLISANEQNPHSDWDTHDKPTSRGVQNPVQ